EARPTSSSTLPVRFDFSAPRCRSIATLSLGHVPRNDFHYVMHLAVLYAVPPPFLLISQLHRVSHCRECKIPTFFLDPLVAFNYSAPEWGKVGNCGSCRIIRRLCVPRRHVADHRQ